MKKINLFSRLWSSGGNSQSSDVGYDCRSTVVRPSFDRRFSLLRLVSVLVLMLTLGVGNAWGALSSPYTCTFTSGMSMSGSNCTTGDVTWTISTTTGKGSPSITFGNQNGQSCIKFGSGKSNYYSKMTLTTSAFSAYNVSSVVIYASSNNGGSKTFKVTQGATQIGTGSQSFSSTTWVTNITRNTTAGSGGDLSIEISSDATATFVHSIKVTYSAACSTPPTVGSSLSSVSATVNSITATVPISSIGGCNITENGLVYSTSVATPTVGAANCTKVTTTACGGTAANKTVTISDLACGTPYYVRGYATNAAGTQYTNVTTQSTSACPLYTVTLKDNDATLTQASAGASVTLPSRAGCSGYTFAGWTKSWVAPQTSWTTTAPTIIPAGSYTPAGDEDLYPVYTKTEGGASEDHDGPSFSRSSSTNTITTGYTLTTNASAAAAYYADQTPNGTNIYVGIYNSSTPIFSSTPSSITITATIGGGSGNKDLGEPILAQLLDNTGSPIGTAATITTHVTNSGGDTYSDISIPTTGITSAYGVRISHIKESGWNARYYSFSLSYTTGGSTTYYISVPNCCTELATINGSFSFTNVSPTSVTVGVPSDYSDKDNANLEGYIFKRYSASTGGTLLETKETNSSSGTTATFNTGLVANTTYYYTITAKHSSSSCNSAETSPRKSHTITSYTVSYAAGDGSGTNPGAHDPVLSGTSVTLKANTFDAPTGKQFAGWNDGSNDYSAGASYSVTANKTMTAQWSCINPTIGTQPASNTYQEGDGPTPLSVAATLASGTLTYLWKVSTDNGVNWSNAAGTNNTASYSGASLNTNSVGTLKFKCIVGNSEGGCTVESNVATITVNAAANFPNGKTIFIQAHSTSAWSDANNDCVKAWFHSAGGHEAAQSTYWLFDASAPDAGKKLFAAIVPATGNLPYLDIQRFSHNCNNYKNKNGGCSYADANGSNTIRSTGKSDTDNANDDYIRWNVSGVTMNLMSSDAWLTPVASVTDQGAGVWSGTYEYTPSNTSTEYIIATNYNGNIGNTGSNNNATLSGMTVGSTYNVTATLDIPTHALTMSKTFVKGTVHFDMQSHGSAISDLTDVYAGSKISAPSPAPTDAAYDFGGWYKEAGCTNEWNFASDEVNETMTLYAKWTLKTYAITYLPGANGTGTVPAGVKNHGESFTLSSSTFSRDHYTQDGWSTSDGGDKVYNLGGSYTTNAALTLYPHWTPATYTVTWYAGGTAPGNVTTAGSPTTNVTYNNKVATLPTNPDGSPCDKVFVGWTNTTSYTHGTSLLFTDAAGSPAITANTNFYAVFATESSGVSSVFSENFNTCAGTGGNDGEWSGSIASSDVPDGINSTWTLTNAKAASECLKLGTGSAGGSAVTPSIDCGSVTTATLTFKAGAWDKTGEGTTLNVSATNCTLDKSSVTLVKGSFTSYSVAISSITSSITITFSTDGANKRFFLDDVVVSASTTTYTGHTITCADCGTSVTPTFTAAPAGGTVAVTKGGNAVTSGSTVKTCTSQELSVTITPASHYTLTGFTASGLTTGTATISPAVGTVLPTTSAQTFTVTVSASATGTLNLTPVLTEDAHIAINWNVNGVAISPSPAEGLTWVYSGGDITALPGEPSVPAGCSGTKVFAGWSEKHSDATPQNASWYDDLFSTVGDAPTGVAATKTFYAVFATSYSNPLAGQTMWAEDFSGYIADDVPSGTTSYSHTGTTVYNSGSVSYACTDGNSVTKIYNATLAGGTTPEILINKSGGAFDVTSIPTANQTELTLSYKSNNSYISVSSGTSGVTIGDPSVSSGVYTYTITISQSPSTTSSFALSFSNPTSSGNSRVDDISLVVPGAASMTDYVTMCAPSYTITYNKNTEDAVTNLPSPTSVLQSTGEGVLSNTIPTRAMYTFTGWATTPAGAATYSAGDDITGVDDDMTLYAVWTKTPVEEIDINYTALERYVGDPTETLEVTNVVPAGADPSVTWSSDNSSVASVVAATGVVTFGVVGTATITATSTVTGTTHAVCYVTVRNKPTATFVDLIHNGNGTDLSDYNLQDVAGTSIVFPTLSNSTPGVETCDDQHYIFVGWTTSNNNTDPEDHLVTSDVLENDVTKTFYAVWADGEEGFTYTQLTSNSFETAPTKYVIGVESGGTMYYFNNCANTGSNNEWGYTTNDPTNNPPIQFTLSGTASELVATSTEATARYLTPLTTKKFRMSGSSQTVQLNADGTIHNPSNDTWNLRGNSTNLRWYDSSTGTSAYFYKVEAGSEVSYRTSCCTNNVDAPTVTATSTAYTATLTWAAVAGATGYEVSWNNGAWTAASSPLVKSTLTPSTTYTYKVRATYEAPKCGALVASGNVTTDDVHTVTYAKGSGTGECTPTGTVTDAGSPYEAGATVTLQANSYSLSGHTFNAWVVKDAEDNDVAVSNNQFTMPASNVTVTATWTAKQDKYYDRMHQSTDASHGGIVDGEGKYYLVREGCNYTVPSPADDSTGDTDCHTTHFKLLGWIAASHLDANGAILSGHESYLFTGGGTKTATGATYYAIYAIMTE